MWPQSPRTPHTELLFAQKRKIGFSPALQSCVRNATAQSLHERAAKQKASGFLDFGSPEPSARSPGPSARSHRAFATEAGAASKFGAERASFILKSPVPSVPASGFCLWAAPLGPRRPAHLPCTGLRCPKQSPAGHRTSRRRSSPLPR